MLFAAHIHVADVLGNHPDRQRGTHKGSDVLPPGLVLRVDTDVFGVAHKQHADHKGRTRHDDWIPEPVMHVAGLRNDGQGGRWQRATEPAVTEVVGQ